MGDPPFHTTAQVETYADGTAGTLLQLTLQACKVPPGTADHSSAHLGRGAGAAQTSQRWHEGRRRADGPRAPPRKDARGMAVPQPRAL